MATGFSVMDALNKNSKAGIEGPPKARFRTKDISIFKMYRNDMNFYKVADIEGLAGDILMHGLKQNLELVYEPCEAGEYRIISGERRWAALRLLVSKGYREFEIATCKLTAPQDADEEQVEIISANAYRIKSIADIIEEEQRLKASLERLRAAGKQIKGYDLNSGRLRDVIASMLRISRTKVAQIESVSNNLIPEFKQELNKKRITFSAAYELSGMAEEEQREALAVYEGDGGITHKDVKAMKGGKATGQQVSKEPGLVSECDTGQVSEYDTGQQDIENIERDPTGVSEIEDRGQSLRSEDGEDRPGDTESTTSLGHPCEGYDKCTKRKKVFICRQFHGNTVENTKKAAGYSRMAFEQGYLPIDPHLLFPQFLDGGKEDERQLGIQMGLDLLLYCDEVWVFGETTEGMITEIGVAKKYGKTVSVMETEDGIIGDEG